MATSAQFTRVLSGRLIYVAVSLVILFVGLVPMGFNPGFTPGPDLLLSLTFAFALRRPDLVPVWLLAGVFLLADVLLMRPPGLWTAVVILTVEFTRTQEYRFRELGFLIEWIYVAVAFLLAFMAYRLVLSVAVVPLASIGSVFLHYFVTVMAYPPVVFFCYVLLRIHKVTPGEAIQFGHRL